MAKEKISDEQKKSIAKMRLRGKQFGELANILNVSESTTRKASNVGTLLNIIDDLKLENRSQEVQIQLLTSTTKVRPFVKKSKNG